MKIISYEAKEISNTITFIIGLDPPLNAFLTTDMASLLAINDPVFKVKAV